MALFGASGDLAGRYLLPALAALAGTGRLPQRFDLLGAARDDWDDAAFRDFAADQLDRFASELPASARDQLLGLLRFRQVDLADTASVGAALDSGGSDARAEAVAAYLALPPGVFAEAVVALAEAGLPAGSRIAVEKPFGESLESARQLNALLRHAVGEAGEQAIFRVDHVLGMETTQHLIGLRLWDAVLASLWDGAHIERVELLWEETLALEGRAGYYDHAGALRDVVQNHLMQLLCLAAMEPPVPPDERHLRDAKVAVLQAVGPSAGEIARRSRRARYEAGRVRERQVPTYASEPGVDPDRQTETFAELSLQLDLPRWADTSFVLRGAKAMSERRKGVLVRFRSPESLPLPGKTDDELWIGIDGPNNISLRLSGAVAGQPPRSQPLLLSGQPPGQPLPAYAHVLTDLLDGKSTLSVRGDEAEESWRIVEPVLASWSAGEVPLRTYPAGAQGL
jgi:glucose-6-phosphate 1-dehydrogenase